MSIVILKLPEVKDEAEKTVRSLSECAKGKPCSAGEGRKRDPRSSGESGVMVYRYRCCRCRHTFRHYPEGVDQAQQSQRLRKLAALMLDIGFELPGHW